MSACRHHNEVLMLDVLGELSDPRARRDWEGHLGVCDGCRGERARLQRLIGEVRRAVAPAELAAERAEAMAGQIVWRLRNERGSRTQKAGPRFRLVPALAAACALLITVVAGYRLHNQVFGPGSDPDIAAVLQLTQQDIEVIENLDLLKQMDTIEKLVNIDDLPSNGQGPEPDEPAATQGMQRDDNGKVYA